MSLLGNMNSVDLGVPNEKFDKAAIVIGSIENHGPVLPHSADALMSWNIAERVAAQVPGLLVLPLVPYGATLHHVSMFGSISLQPQTLVAIVLDLMKSLTRHGIKKFWFVSNHDGNIGPLEMAARQMRDIDPEVVVTCQVHWWDPAQGVVPENTYDSPGRTWAGHGGEAETSFLLETNPDLVRMELAEDFGWPYDRVPKGGLVYWKFAELTDRGATGDPRTSTAPKGKILLDSIVDHSVRFLKQMDDSGWKYGVME
jgi:creatinine amidohydrolase